MMAHIAEQHKTIKDDPMVRLADVGSRTIALCFSAGVVIWMGEAYSLKLDDSSGDQINEIISKDAAAAIRFTAALLAQMSEAGAEYAALAYGEEYPSLTEKQFLTVIDIRNIKVWQEIAFGALGTGIQREVIAEPVPHPKDPPA